MVRLLQISRGLGALLVCAALLSFAVPTAAKALEPEQAEQLVEMLTEDMLSIINSSDTNTQKEQRFEQLLRDFLALRTFARVVLGPPWKELSEEDRAAYQEALLRYMAVKYLVFFRAHEDEINTVTGSRPRRNDIIVSSKVTGSQFSDALLLEWLVTEREGPVQFLDVSIDGVSIAVTERTEITAVLRGRGGDIDAMIAYLNNYAR